jgi:hypothetical protein
LRRPPLFVPLLFTACLLGAGASTAPQAVAVPTTAVPTSSATPDLSAGLDWKRFQQDSYQEQLTGVAERLRQTKEKLKTIAADDPGLVDFGYALGIETLVVYWSGSPDSPTLARMRDTSDSVGTKLLVAPRKVSKEQLATATGLLEQRMEDYKKAGISLSAFGGLADDFDGVKVSVDPATSELADPSVITERLQRDLGVPVQVTMAAVHTATGRYDDSSLYAGGGLMYSQGTFDRQHKICTSGFGVVKGASQYRYLSARHCVYGPYLTELGGKPMGSIEQAGTGNNGAAVFSAGGFYWIWSGLLGDNTSYRTLTQRDPDLNTIGYSICHEGANSGQKCGKIRQVGLSFLDGYGTIKANYVTADDGSYILAGGDSGAPVISLHTLSRAWAVGIIQGAQEPNITTCTLHFPGNPCWNNFYFSNLDYAMSGFSPTYAVQYG